MTEKNEDLTIRQLSDGDASALVRLAQLDTSEVPSGAVIGAFDPSGTLLAAISLETGELVADPFIPSSHAATLLRVRAGQVGPAGKRIGRRFRRRVSAALAVPS